MLETCEHGKVYQDGARLQREMVEKDLWIRGSGPGLSHTLVFDVSHPGEPMLATFFYGEVAVEYSGDVKKDERKAEAIEGAQRLVSDADAPDPRSLEPSSVVEGDWPSTPHIHGAYAGVPKAGAITKHKHHRQTLGESFKRIHFAGTETSEHWAGYIEGASESLHLTN